MYQALSPALVTRTSLPESGLSPQLQRRKGRLGEVKGQVPGLTAGSRCTYSGILPRASETPKVALLGKATLKGQRKWARWSRGTTPKGRINWSNNHRSRRGRASGLRALEWLAPESSDLTRLEKITAKDSCSQALISGARTWRAKIDV